MSTRTRNDGITLNYYYDNYSNQTGEGDRIHEAKTVKNKELEGNNKFDKDQWFDCNIEVRFVDEEGSISESFSIV